MSERDLSKLLIYNGGDIVQTIFKELPNYLPSKSLLVFNDSKVIPARLLFHTENGATVEVLCINPIGNESRSNGYSFQKWKCVIGNLKRWKEGVKLSIETEGLVFSGEVIHRGGEENEVLFEWTGEYSFLEVLELLGKIPLPPYMNRNADEMDSIRYQTVYASTPGSVAAPTAGLHFTEQVLESLQKDGHEQVYVTLHVGAGTFKPIKTYNIEEHKMHQEFFEVERSLIEKLLETETIITIGTTSMRTLESLFHLGSQFLKGNYELKIDQWVGFERCNYTKTECLNALLNWMNENAQNSILAETSIMIVPGYKFQICKGIVTNFHQPESTLILLVAALLGEKWRNVYEYALDNNFRFLSYGDSSLLIP